MYKYPTLAYLNMRGQRRKRITVLRIRKIVPAYPKISSIMKKFRKQIEIESL
jgi:hypothetical protein